MCIRLHPVGVLTDVHIILLQSSNAFIVLNKQKQLHPFRGGAFLLELGIRRGRPPKVGQKSVPWTLRNDTFS